MIKHLKNLIGDLLGHQRLECCGKTAWQMEFLYAPRTVCLDCFKAHPETYSKHRYVYRDDLDAFSTTCWHSKT